MFNLILLAAFSPEFLYQKLNQPEYLHTFLLSYIRLFLRYKWVLILSVQFLVASPLRTGNALVYICKVCFIWSETGAFPTKQCQPGGHGHIVGKSFSDREGAGFFLNKYLCGKMGEINKWPRGMVEIKLSISLVKYKNDQAKTPWFRIFLRKLQIR